MVITGRAAKCHRENVLEYTQYGMEVTLRIPKSSLHLLRFFFV